MKRVVVKIGSDIPLIGCITFGIIDRGTNLLQIRPISGCNLSCPYCSVDEGRKSRTRVGMYVVELEHLVETAKEVACFKGGGVEMHIDGCGEPMLYPDIIELVSLLSDIPEVEVVSMQTNGTLLTHSLVDELSESGLTRLNLSLNALNEEVAKLLSGVEHYDVCRVVEIASYIPSTNTELLLAPVWLPNINDSEIERMIDFSVEIGAGGRFPSLGIQKYEAHRFGRKMWGVRIPTWKEFYSWLDVLEKRHKTKLIICPSDFGIVKKPFIPLSFRRFEKVKVKVVAQGWMRNEKIAVAKDRVITLVDAKRIPVGCEVMARIIHTKHNIYIAKPVG
jgi:hypothetical protein